MSKFLIQSLEAKIKQHINKEKQDSQLIQSLESIIKQQDEDIQSLESKIKQDEDEDEDKDIVELEKDIQKQHKIIYTLREEYKEIQKQNNKKNELIIDTYCGKIVLLKKGTEQYKIIHKQFKKDSREQTAIIADVREEYMEIQKQNNKKELLLITELFQMKTKKDSVNETV